MKILIVLAHPEPQSFCAALAQRAQAALERQGHEVVLNDLRLTGFQPVSDRRNFRQKLDEKYLKLQLEEKHAHEHGAFARDVEKEIAKLEAADALIFAFPLWWFGLPAQLKGWVDRVFAFGRVYGLGQLYENGLGRGTKRALVLMTTGGSEEMYGGRGVNPAMETILTPIHHGIFWFNGFLPLDPFIAYSPARRDDAARAQLLDQLEARLATFASEEPRRLPPLSDFPDWGVDSQRRFMVTIHRTKPVDDAYRARVPAELALLTRLRHTGFVRYFEMMPTDAPDWRGFMELRAPDEAAVQTMLSSLPLAAWLGFDVRALA
jgi:NAD(P)H dehydrogenase (quinone)